MNGYNFTERVRKVLALAREEAGLLRHEYVGTEHILLGIIREGEGVAAAVLTNLGVNLGQLRDTTVAAVEPGLNHHGRPDLPYTSRAKKVLEFAMAEARELNHSYVGTEHLLLGLLREARGIGAEILVASGVTLASARHETLRMLSNEPRASVTEPAHVVFVRRTSQAWHELSEPLRGIVEAAFDAARKHARSEPTVADVLEATILSSPDVSAAFTKREIEIDALIADVRAASNDTPSA